MSLEIWYAKPEFIRDTMMGPDFLKEHRPELLAQLCRNIDSTHTFVMDFDSSSMDLAFIAMQGENWSPNGEARPLIEKLGLSHTSMSVGDIILGDGMWMVDRFGFKKIEWQPEWFTDDQLDIQIEDLEAELRLHPDCLDAQTYYQELCEERSRRQG